MAISDLETSVRNSTEGTSSHLPFFQRQREEETDAQQRPRTLSSGTTRPSTTAGPSRRPTSTPTRRTRRPATHPPTSASTGSSSPLRLSGTPCWRGSACSRHRPPHRDQHPRRRSGTRSTRSTCTSSTTTTASPRRPPSWCRTLASPPMAPACAS